MFIAMLRVEMVLEAGWSRLLTLASCPNTNSPPTCGQRNGAADARPVEHTNAAASPIGASIARAIGMSPGCCGVTERQDQERQDQEREDQEREDQIIVLPPAERMRGMSARSFSRPSIILPPRICEPHSPASKRWAH